MVCLRDAEAHSHRRIDVGELKTQRAQIYRSHMPGPWRRLWELFVLADKLVVGDFENHRMPGL